MSIRDVNTINNLIYISMHFYLFVDINECRETPNGGCQQICRNAPGKFSCGCFRGFRLMANNGTHCKGEQTFQLFISKTYSQILPG